MQEISNDLSEKLIPKDFQGDNGDDIDMSKIFNNEYNTAEHASEKYFKQNLQTVEYVGQLFKTDFEHGLSTSNKQDMEWREKKWGNNHLPPEKENSILAEILKCFEDPMLVTLLIASIVSLAIGLAKDGIKTGWIEGTAIFFAVFLVVSISSYMNYQENEQFLALTRESRLKKVLVIRDGMEKEISIEDILVGDILKLRIGDIINVDGFVFGDAKAGMDESPVTGESDVMWKMNTFEVKGQKYTCPFVFSGSQVVDGYGNMVVAAVGNKTFEGQNKQLLSSLLLIAATQGVLIFPVVLLLVYFGLSLQNVLYYCIIVVIIAKFLTFYKSHIIFFRQKGGFLRNILYFCALEIVPFVALVGVSVALVDFLKINF